MAIAATFKKKLGCIERTGFLVPGQHCAAGIEWTDLYQAT